MARKRRLLVLAALAALALALAAAVVLWPQPSQVTRANYDNIKPGMTRRDVETLLGGPPGNYAGGPTGPAGDHYAEILSNLDECVREPVWWQGDSATVAVHFGQTGLADWKAYFPTEREEQTPLANVEWRVRRQWKRRFP
jgi:hypothetical protein